MKNTNIFVYGTLRRKGGNHNILSGATFLGNAITQSKYAMHSSSSIPFVSEQQPVSAIVGEVYSVDENTFQLLDRLEHCIPSTSDSSGFASRSWYIRKEVSVSMEDGQEVIQAWMYINEQETHYAIVRSGDFFNRSVEESNKHWYFAYGSNMMLSRMFERKAFFTQRIKAYLPKHQLVFNKAAKGSSDEGYANIVQAEQQTTLGILYEIDDHGLRELDKREGVATQHYKRITMAVESEIGMVEAQVYIAHPSKIGTGLRPSAQYIGYLHGGVEFYGQALRESIDLAVRLSDAGCVGKLIDGSEIPFLENEQLDDHAKHALDVRVNGKKAKAFYYLGGWSERLVLCFEKGDAEYFSTIGLSINEENHYEFGTKYFIFPAPGILEIPDLKLVISRGLG